MVEDQLTAGSGISAMLIWYSSSTQACTATHKETNSKSTEAHAGRISDKDLWAMLIIIASLD